MNTCSNCYSGCTETTSDKCVKYTGLDYPILGIKNGDSLAYVENAIMTFLVSTLDATGISYSIDVDALCGIIGDQLDECETIGIKDVINATINAVCTIDARVTQAESDISEINSPVAIGCVATTGATGSEGINAIVQAVITKLCEVDAALTAFILDVETNYVQISDIDTYIENYITNNSENPNAQKFKMIPYTVMEYYGPLNYFDVTGAGIGDWEDIYLCNGQNPGVPDKRGRIAVGTTTGMGGGAFPSATDPLLPGNPTYALYTTTGSNTVTLTESQIPSHTHTSVMGTSGDHIHPLGGNVVVNPWGGSDAGGTLSTSDNRATQYITETGAGGDHTHTLNINPTGGGNSHNNIPPVLACHYIIYIPS